MECDIYVNTHDLKKGNSEMTAISAIGKSVTPNKTITDFETVLNDIINQQINNKIENFLAMLSNQNVETIQSYTDTLPKA